MSKCLTPERVGAVTLGHSVFDKVYLVRDALADQQHYYTMSIVTEGAALILILVATAVSVSFIVASVFQAGTTG